MNELLLTCRIAGRRAAIPALCVQSVIEVGEVTPILGTPDFIRGLTALRSQALTVIDCSLALGLKPGPIAADQRAAVVAIDGHPYALLVDEAYDVDEAISGPIEVPGGFGAEWQRAARGLVETTSGPTLLINIESLVAGPAPMAA